MACGFMPRLDYRSGKLRAAFHRASAHVKGGWGLRILQRFEKPPKPNARAIGKDLFLALIAAAFGHNAQHFAHTFRGRIAIAHLDFGPFLEVHHNRHRQAGPVGPNYVGRLIRITNEITVRHQTIVPIQECVWDRRRPLA